MGDFTRTRYLEPFLGTRVCFYLWHFIQFNFYTLLAPPNRRRTFCPVGNPDFCKILKWAAKVANLSG